MKIMMQGNISEFNDEKVLYEAFKAVEILSGALGNAGLTPDDFYVRLEPYEVENILRVFDEHKTLKATFEKEMRDKR